MQRTIQSQKNCFQCFYSSLPLPSNAEQQKVVISIILYDSDLTRRGFKSGILISRAQASCAEDGELYSWSSQAIDL